MREGHAKKTPPHRRCMFAKSCTDAQTACLEYTRARNIVEKLTRKAKREFENGICLESFWWYVRHKLKTKTGVAPLLENNKTLESTKFEYQHKANILPRQFSYVLTREHETGIPKLDKKTNASISQLFVTDEGREEILTINVNILCGPENVHPRLLIELAESLFTPI